MRCEDDDNFVWQTVAPPHIHAQLRKPARQTKGIVLPKTLVVFNEDKAAVLTPLLRPWPFIVLVITLCMDTPASFLVLSILVFLVCCLSLNVLSVRPKLKDILQERGYCVLLCTTRTLQILGALFDRILRIRSYVHRCIRS